MTEKPSETLTDGTGVGNVELLEGQLAAARAEAARLREEVERVKGNAVSILMSGCTKHHRPSVDDLRGCLLCERAALEKAHALLREWLDTELDTMDEEFAPWIEQFTKRVKAALEARDE
jgi:hypothetical protein